MARFRRILAFAKSCQWSALVLCYGLVMACGALPIRVQSLSSPSRDPELIPTQPETFPEYASERLAKMDNRQEISPDTEAYQADDDPFTLYQHGGREVLRHVLRRLRDEAALEAKESAAPAPWLRNFNQDRCLNSSLSELFNRVFPHRDLSLLLGALGWQGLTLRDPIPMDPFLGKESMVDDLHRLLLFEAGIKVEGRWFQDSSVKVFELVYKVVHERGEPEDWQTGDLKSTKITWVWTHNSPHQWRVQWRVAVAQGLYESFPLEPEGTEIKGFHADLGFVQQGDRSAFEGRLVHGTQTLNFGWQQNDANNNLQLFWSTNLQPASQSLSLRQVDSRLCVQSE